MDLQNMRSNIDRIDSEILRLLTKRLEYAVRTKRFKENVSDPSREEQVLQRIKNHSRWLIRQEFSHSLFSQIMAESRVLQSLEAPLVGFNGEHGALTEYALTRISNTWMPIPHSEMSEIFEALKSGALDYGVVPIENSVEGGLSNVLDELISCDLSIVGEIAIPVHYCLLALPESDHRDLKVVYSHPEVLSHCRGFISRNRLDPKPYYDAAGAALMLTRERLSGAAVITNKLCAEIYNLNVLVEAVEDQKDNTTRFIVLGRSPSKEKGTKCSIVFSATHTAGSLHSTLKLFSDAQINLTRIESRPIPESEGSVAFVLDFFGSKEDEAVARVLAQVEASSSMFRFLGCYNIYSHQEK